MNFELLVFWTKNSRRLSKAEEKIVFDLFHVVAKFGREVVDRVRVEEANRLRQDKPARAVIKHARWQNDQSKRQNHFTTGLAWSWDR